MGSFLENLLATVGEACDAYVSLNLQTKIARAFENSELQRSELRIIDRALVDAINNIEGQQHEKCNTLRDIERGVRDAIARK